MWYIRVEPVADKAMSLVAAARQDVHRVALVLVSVSWRARPGSPRADEGKMVRLAEAPVKENAIADLSLQEHTVEAAAARTSLVGLPVRSPYFPIDH